MSVLRSSHITDTKTQASFYRRSYVAQAGPELTEDDLELVLLPSLRLGWRVVCINTDCLPCRFPPSGCLFQDTGSQQTASGLLDCYLVIDLRQTLVCKMRVAQFPLTLPTLPNHLGPAPGGILPGVVVFKLVSF